MIRKKIYNELMKRDSILIVDLTLKTFIFKIFFFQV